MPESWRALALAPPRAFGAPLGVARTRETPEDFVVEEELGFAPAGDGPHLLVKVRKRNANTEWVARELARAAGCRPGEVGFAGLKDRHALATQWFSVPRSPGAQARLAELRGAQFEVLEWHAHSRKLPRGALLGNRFLIRLRGVAAADEAIAARMEAIARAGVPNYFGPQRFGRDGANLDRIHAGLRALSPRERGFVLSAARSLVFNAVLTERVRDGTWQHIEPGDVANLDGRGSIFAVEEVDETLRARCERLEIHPTGPLWGRGELTSSGRVRELEQRIAGTLESASELVVEAGMEQERRPLRLAVRDLSFQREQADLLVGFALRRGSFATAVIREIADADAVEE